MAEGEDGMTQVDRKKYRIEIPNIVDDMDLSVYAFRLYAHIKRVAGEDGQCWQGSKTLATACKMSVGKVSDAKNELIAAGLIAVVPGEWNKGKSDEIRVVDVWDKNLETFSQNEKTFSPHEKVEQKTVETFSPHESTFSPHEPKKEPIKKEQIIITETPVKANGDDDKKSKPETSDRDGRWTIAKIEAKGFMYMENNARMMAMKLESEYTDTQLLQAIETTHQAHMKKIATGNRGITAPLAYIASVLAGNQPVAVNGNGNGNSAAPVRKTQSARNRMNQIA
jgi:hypothetical protein